MNKNSKILILGSNGLVGSSIVRQLKSSGHTDIITSTRSDVNLLDTVAVNDYISKISPEFVFLAAAKVGGIHANNTYPAEFIYQNLMIQTNVIDTCYKTNVKKLLNLGSCCIYPKFADVPVKESSLLNGELEPTNDAYAIAKIAGIKMCQAYKKQYGCDFISVMPSNLFGPNDSFHPENSHVIPALIRKFVHAKQNNLSEITCWGTGNARREFMYVDDMSDACIFLMNNYSDESIINIGFGIDYTIKELVNTIANLVNYTGSILWDTTKPDGTPKRMLDSTKLFALGWKPKVDLYTGLEKTIQWYISANQI